MSLCVSCQEEIYTPVCPECLYEHILKWLKDEELEKEFKEIIPKFFQHMHGQMYCARHGKTNFQICPYCFSEIVYRWLLKRKPQLLKNYLKEFNYDFNKTGYTVNKFYSEDLISDKFI